MVLTPPTLVTARLELRPPVASDLPLSLAIAADPETGRFLNRPTSAAEHFLRFCRSAGSWLLYGYGAFVIRARDGDEVIGTCGVFHSWRDLGPDFDDQPEAGWMLRADRQSQGLGREAMLAVLDWFDRAHGLRVGCMIDPGNAPSIRLAERLGFVPLREAQLPNEDAVLQLFERPAAGGP